MQTGKKFPANYFLQLFKAAPISIRKNENAGKQENPAFLYFLLFSFCRPLQERRFRPAPNMRPDRRIRSYGLTFSVRFHQTKRMAKALRPIPKNHRMDQCLCRDIGPRGSIVAEISISAGLFLPNSMIAPISICNRHDIRKGP